jgi:hypothetical protein
MVARRVSCERIPRTKRRISGIVLELGAQPFLPGEQVR